MEDFENEQIIHFTWLEEKIQPFLEADDVFRGGFFTRVILKTCDIKLRPPLTDGAKAVLAQWGSTAQFIQSGTKIPSGPYAPKKTRLFQVFRLYPDPQLAFMCGIVPIVDKHQYKRLAPSKRAITCVTKMLMSSHKASSLHT